MSARSSQRARGKHAEDGGLGLGLRGRALVRLGVVLLAVATLLIGIGQLGVPFTSFHGELHETRQSAFSELSLVADTKAERLLRWLEERRDDVEVLAGADVNRDAILELLPVVDAAGSTERKAIRAALARSPTYDRLRSSLRQVRDRYGVYESIAVAAAPSGTVVVSTDDDLVGRAVSSHAFFRDALTTDDVVFLPLPPQAGEPLQLVMVRALRPGETAPSGRKPSAVIIAFIRPDDILEPLLYTGGELGETGEVVLVDAAGLHLTDLRLPLPGGEPPPAPRTRPLDGEPAKLTTAGLDGVTEALDYRGQRVLAAYRSLELPGGGNWGLVVKQDVAEAMAPLWRRLSLRAFLAGVGVLAVLGLAGFILTTLTRPLRELGEVAERVRHGDLEARTTIPSSGELATVASAFNAMLERLQSRQEEAEGSAELFRRLLDRSGEEIYVADTGGHIVDANRTALERLGYERDELLDMRVTDVVDDSGGDDGWTRTLAYLGEHQRLVIEGRHVRRDGSTYPVETTVVLQDVGDERYVLAVARDISERHEAEKERHRLATAIEQSADSVMITDPEGRIQYVNSAFEKVSGYTREEVTGRIPPFLDNDTHPEELYRDIWETVTAGRAWKGRIVNETRDGSVYREEATITPVFNAAGQITNLVAVKQDVTEREEMEAQLRQAQKMEGVGQLAAGIAHDFNNLLTGITGYSQLLRARFDEGPEREDLDKIVDLAGQAASLTRQLLVFSRRAPIDPMPMNLNDAVRSTFELVERLIGEDIESVLELADDLGTVTADPGQIEQIVVNLCVNARDAMPDGGRLTVRTANVELDERFAERHLGTAPGPWVTLEVSDTGVGMDPATQGRIFEPFFTTKETGRGTGLGLATVHGIVQQHGGTITVDTAPGEGSTFGVYLPRIEDAARRSDATSSDELPGGSETILLVEDEAAVRQIVDRMLRARGYNVVSAADPDAALAAYEALEGEVDLLVTDVVMPEISGRRLAEALCERSPGLKVLFISGYTEGARQARGGLEPGVPFLQKPFAPGSLACRVREVLDG